MERFSASGGAALWRHARKPTLGYRHLLARLDRAVCRCPLVRPRSQHYCYWRCNGFDLRVFPRQFPSFFLNLLIADRPSPLYRAFWLIPICKSTSHLIDVVLNSHPDNTVLPLSPPTPWSGLPLQPLLPFLQPRCSRMYVTFETRLSLTYPSPSLLSSLASIGPVPSSVSWVSCSSPHPSSFTSMVPGFGAAATLHLAL